jgi:hypothetical protein
LGRVGRVGLGLLVPWIGKVRTAGIGSMGTIREEAIPATWVAGDDSFFPAWINASSAAPTFEYAPMLIGITRQLTTTSTSSSIIDLYTYYLDYNTHESRGKFCFDIDLYAKEKSFYL